MAYITNIYILPHFTTPCFRMVLPVISFYPFTFYSVFLLIHSLVNANGIPYVCAAFCDFVTLCDGPDDDHLIGRNMLSM